MGRVPHFINAREIAGRRVSAAVCLADGSNIVDRCTSRDYKEACLGVLKGVEEGQESDVGPVGRHDRLVESQH